jgi:uncharacterized membrane protein
MRFFLFYAALAGFAFSGYMSGVKFFTQQCAFGETCPLFLGVPACYFGFAMFLTITLFTGIHAYTRVSPKAMLLATIADAVAGILFAGYFTLGELPVLFEKGLYAYLFGLPTCALGLIFYVLILVLAVKTMRGLQPTV